MGRIGILCHGSNLHRFGIGSNGLGSTLKNAKFKGDNLLISTQVHSTQFDLSQFDLSYSTKRVDLILFDLFHPTHFMQSSAKTWRRTFRQKNMPKRLRLKTFAETFRMICGAYPVNARSPSPSRRPAPTTIASRSPFPLGLCSCKTSLSKMGI